MQINAIPTQMRPIPANFLPEVRVQISPVSVPSTEAIESIIRENGPIDVYCRYEGVLTRTTKEPFLRDRIHNLL